MKTILIGGVLGATFVLAKILTNTGFALVGEQMWYDVNRVGGGLLGGLFLGWLFLMGRRFFARP